jgi:hypothetical protein
MLGFFVSAANDELKDKPVMSAIAASVVFMFCFLCFWVVPVLPAKVSERERRLTFYSAPKERRGFQGDTATKVPALAASVSLQPADW